MAEEIKSTFKKSMSRVAEGAADYIKSRVENVADRTERRIIQLETAMLIKLSGVVFLIIGVVFLGLSLFNLLVEYAGLSNSLSYFILGVIVMLLGFGLNNLKGGR